MCQLLGMNCNVPTDICFSFEGFSARGGKTDEQLSYIVRQAPFAAAHLLDEDITVDFQELTRPSDRVAIIATTPLTNNEIWIPLQPGELLVFQDGLPHKFA